MFYVWLMFYGLVVWIIYSFCNAITKLATKQYKSADKDAIIIALIVGVLNLAWVSAIIINLAHTTLVDAWPAVIISLLMTLDDVPKKPLQIG